MTSYYVAYPDTNGVGRSSPSERDAYHTTYHAVARAYRYIVLRCPSHTPIPTIVGSAYDTSRRPTIVGSAYDTSRRQQHGTSSHSLTLVRNVLRRRQYNQQYGGAGVWMRRLCFLQEDV